MIMKIIVFIIEIILCVIIVFSIIKIIYYMNYIHNMDKKYNVQPLKIRDLKDMIGNPVWVKKYDEWMLVHAVTNTLIEVIDYNGFFLIFTVDDLKTTPLYKLRGEE